MARIKTERVVLLLTPEQRAALDGAVAAAAKQKGLRDPNVTSFVRDMVLDWVDEQQKNASKPTSFGSTAVPQEK